MQDVQFGSWIGQGFAAYKQGMATLVVAGLIAAVIAVASLGILAGPMGAGMALMALTLVDGKRPAPMVSDLFQGFGFFLQTFVFVLAWILIVLLGSSVLSVLPVIGQILSMVYSWTINAFFMFTIFLIVDGKQNIIPAIIKSVEAVCSNLLPMLAFGIITSMIGWVGLLACGVGAFFTYPLTICIMAAAYRGVFSGPRPFESRWSRGRGSFGGGGGMGGGRKGRASWGKGRGRNRMS